MYSTTASGEVNRPRLCWTRWFNRDRPSASGDWETLKSLREEYPGKICPAKLKNFEQNISSYKLVIYNTKTGFVCRNKDQKRGRCLDYKVRFRCPCRHCWTQWYNRDTPSATGDWETLADLRKENPGKLCPHPSAVQAVTIFIGIPAEQTGQTFYFPSKGFVCRNQDQPSGNCFNYKVRFKCPCFGIP
uniref:WxxW domain-containing protein n=1 Tax=Kryptolebias marmoratus TaxID=37003 RepID=A0A3Q3BC91_KRYMA